MVVASVVNALIVEDNVPFRESFKRFLLDHYPFLRIAEAGDAVEATRAIEASVPDLIFMDIQLPGTSGIQLTKEIKARHPEVKIVVVTNYAEPEFRAEAIASKADAFFPKESVGGEEFATLIESISAGMSIDSQGVGARSVPGARPTDEPEAQKDEEEVEGQALTKAGFQFA
jgi:DNA-binding NarL/FixJ family response regulator